MNDSSGLAHDTDREASDSMRGYWSQVWRSVLVWVDLADSERLYLEGAEDFDRVNGIEAEAVQVKDTAGNLTLRSPDVVEAINNAFEHQRLNPGRKIRLRFLTTSGIGSEQGAPFRDQTPGLELWRSCRESTDTPEAEMDARAIADFLVAEGKISGRVREFLRTGSPAAIREKLISVIEWDTFADDALQVIQSVKDRLVVLGEGRGIPSESAEAVADHLYALAFGVATLSKDRYITRADLLRAFDQRTRLSVPAATIAALLAINPKERTPGSALTFAVGNRSAKIVLPPPLPARYYPRTAALSELLERLTESAVLIIQGGTGVGKSVLASGHCATSTSSWGWVDLRGVSDIAPVLDLVSRELAAEGGVTHLALDDIELPSDSRPLERPLMAIRNTLAQRKGQLLITSAVELPQRLALALGVSGKNTVPVAPFEHNETACFLLSRGCPPSAADQLATIIQLHTSGHAQLVHARVATLETQGFPTPDLQALITTPNDVVEARTEAKKLIATLDGEMRELIYRLSLTPQSLPHRYVLAIAGHAPPINEPGLVFDRLVGPWIERVTEGLYRISPLLSGVGKEIQGASWATAMHGAAARAILGLGTLSPTDVSSILLHGTAGRDWKTVAHLSFALLTAEAEVWDALSQSAAWFMSVGVGSSERPRGDHFTIFLIRTLQLRLAMAAKDIESLEAVIACAKEETPAKIEDVSVRLIRHHFLAQVLRAEVTLPVVQIIDNAFDFLRVSDELGELLAGFKKADKVLIGPGGAPDLAALAGFSLMQRITDRVSLTNLIDACEPMEHGSVQRILWFVGGAEPTALIICERIWLAEFNSSSPDWPSCRAIFERAYAFGRRFNLPGLAQGAARVIIRITAENLNDAVSALALAERMVAEVGSSPGQEDQRAAVLLDQGDNAGALGIWREVLPIWNPRDEFDLQPAFSRRRAAIAAARLNEWKEAAEWLHGAWRVATETDADNDVFGAGLLIDEGYAWWKGRDNDRALDRMTEGLTAIGKLPLDQADERAYLLRKRAGYTLTWVAHGGRDLPSIEGYNPPAFALCSGMEPVKGQREPSTPEDSIWLSLLEFEFLATNSNRLFIEHEARLVVSSYGLVRFRFARLRIKYCLKNLVIHDFVDVVAHHSQSAELCRRYYYEGGLQLADPLPRDADSNGPLASDVGLFLVGMLYAVFALGARSAVSEQVLDRWRASASPAGVSAELTSWLDFVAGLFVEHRLNAEKEMRDVSRISAFQLAATIRYAIDDDAEPSTLLMTHDFWATMAPKFDSGALVLSDIELMVTRAWRSMCERPYLLRAPATTVPAIRAACAGSSSGWRKIGEILIAACDGVSGHVPSEMRRRIAALVQDSVSS